jgi:replicative DNA helicase
VAFIYREELYKPDDPEVEGLAEVLIAKHRNGETGMIELAFMGETTTFKNLDRHHASQPSDASEPSEPGYH